MLKATVIGHVGQDATIKSFGNANYIAFSVAHSEKYKDKDGVDHEVTKWVSCLKRIGENSNLAAYIKKGTKVYVEGALSAKVFESMASNEMQVALNVNVSHLELLSPKTDETRPQAVPQAPQATNTTGATLHPPVVVPALQGDDDEDGGLPF